MDKIEIKFEVEEDDDCIRFYRDLSHGMITTNSIKMDYIFRGWLDTFGVPDQICIDKVTYIRKDGV